MIRLPVRLTPLVILAVLLLLGLRLNGLVQPLIGPAAQAAEEKPAAQAEETKAAAPDAEAEAAKPAETEKAAAKPDSAKPAAGKTPAKKPADRRAEELPPRDCSTAELALLGDLTKRQEKLAAAEAALGQREALMTAAEARFNEKLAELNKSRDAIQALLKQKSAEEEASLRSLVKMYEAMKPADAARIFDSLDLPLLTDVATRMKEAKLAPIVAQMAPDAARALTERLAGQAKPPAPPAPAQ